VRRTPPIGERDRTDDGAGRTALVTGASSGIGKALTEVLAAKGFAVVPVARRADRLDALASELRARFDADVEPLVADLADPGAPLAIVQEMESRGRHVDYLVNNAGYNMMGSYLRGSWEEDERFIRVLGLSTMELTRRLVSGMVDRQWGRVLNVSSTSAFMPGSPGMVLYSGVKAMVHKFTEGLATEVARHGVHCTASAPGFTDTEAFEVVGAGEIVNGNKVLRALMMSPARVAREAYAACENGQRVVVHGAPNRFWVFMLTHAPRPLRYKMVAKQGGLDIDELDTLIPPSSLAGD
jgi:short-subunit dehydrogenase